MSPLTAFIWANWLGLSPYVAGRLSPLAPSLAPKQHEIFWCSNGQKTVSVITAQDSVGRSGGSAVLHASPPTGSGLAAAGCLWWSADPSLQDPSVRVAPSYDLPSLSVRSRSPLLSG